MSTHSSRAASACTSAIALALSMACPLEVAAQAAAGEATTSGAALPSEPTSIQQVELPPEVRALLDEEPAPAAPSAATSEPAPSPSWTPEAALPPAPAAVWDPGPRRPDATSLATSSSTDSFVATSAGALIAGGALGALGIVLRRLEETERVCGRLAGCVEAPSEGNRAREGAAYALIGAGVGASATGGLSLLISLTNPPEHGGARGASTQGAIGIGLTSAGGALLGGGIAAAAAGDARVDDGIVPALVSAGLASACVGSVLLIARSGDDEAEAPRAGTPWPSLSVGLGSAEAGWSF